MRKSFPTLVFALFLMVCFPAFASAAEVRLRIRPPETPVTVGELLPVTVEVTENPGFSGVQFALTCDTDQMECVSISLGPMLDGTFNGTNPSRPGGAFLLAASMGVIRQTGTLAEFQFRAKTDLDQFRFGMAEAAFSQLDGVSVPFSVDGLSGDFPPPEPTPADSGAPPDDSGDSTEPGESDSTPADPAGNESPVPPAEEPPDSAPAFTDIADHIYDAAIREAARRDLFHGYPDGTFRPDNPLTRAQFMTVLWNQAGRPEPSAATPFTDLDDTIEEFRNAIAWAYSRGWIDGTTPSTFSPDALLTRQACMKILYGFNGGRSAVMARMFEGTYDRYYKDSPLIPDWAKIPLYWAVYNEVLTDAAPGILDPAGIVTRGLLADIMVRYTDNFPD